MDSYIVVWILSVLVAFYIGFGMGKLSNFPNETPDAKTPTRNLWGWGTARIGYLNEKLIRVDILEYTTETYRIILNGDEVIVPKSEMCKVNGEWFKMIEAHKGTKPVKEFSNPIPEPKKISMNEFLSTVVEHEKEVGTYTEAIIDPERFRAPKFKA